MDVPSIHTKTLRHLQDAMGKDSNELGKHIIGVTDDQAFYKLFHSFRGKNEHKGLRLTWLGYEIIRTYFRAFEIPVPSDYRMGTLDLLYLDNRARMPYYIGRGEGEDGLTKFVVFEAKLAVVLKLADGMVRTLREMEG
jgi:hypothetical protein